MRMRVVIINDRTKVEYQAVLLSEGATQSLIVPVEHVLDKPQCMWVPNKYIVKKGLFSK